MATVSLWCFGKALPRGTALFSHLPLHGLQGCQFSHPENQVPGSSPWCQADSRQGDSARPIQHLHLCLSPPAHPRMSDLTEPLVQYLQRFWTALHPVLPQAESSYHPLAFKHKTAKELSYLCHCSTIPASFFHNPLIHDFGFRQAVTHYWKATYY